MLSNRDNFYKKIFLSCGFLLRWSIAALKFWAKSIGPAVMSTDPSDSTYDLVVPPSQKLPVQPAPQVIEYRRVVPAQPVASQTVPQKKEEPSRKLTFSERLFYWLRMFGCLCLILIGAGWLVPMHHFDDLTLISMGIGFGIIGVGFAFFLFAGPSDSEKKGYHF
jgi:hypothetical protein